MKNRNSKYKTSIGLMIRTFYYLILKVMEECWYWMG